MPPLIPQRREQRQVSIMRGLLFSSVVVLAALHLATSLKVNGDQEVKEENQAGQRTFYQLGLRKFCRRISTWLSTTGAAIIAGTSGLPVSQWTEQELFVRFMNTLCGVSRELDDRNLLMEQNLPVPAEMERLFGLITALDPTTVVCRRIRSFLVTTGATIMQSASSIPTLLTTPQVLISMLYAACSITRDAQMTDEDFLVAFSLTPGPIAHIG
ncbi:hypothetical protein OTU49_011253 [Cherax quadricarinatus]|uniref:Uncharacterized protein n=1 Tax=Cherax quadricarinatus TaxID=27406 RepID=A0AAW0W4P5_CHEQU|nr:uncharacterized protein LOC128703056 [Cherax quadricarinatus]